MILADLKKFEKECLERNLPIMGRERGEWLYRKILELTPKKILELGTANGYSGCILGSQGAKLVTVEIEPEKAEEAKENFKRFGINARIVVVDGVEIVKELARKKRKFDIVFIDFAQRKYLEVLEDCIKLIGNGGHIIADNVFLSKCKDYIEAVKAHPVLRTEIIRISQGLACSQKI